ncbi:MAG TPA: cation:proton antiporter [Gemmatimonadales bacterium]|nr:cation:proton antiporter [Gemmatimonadales bacterium]
MEHLPAFLGDLTAVLGVAAIITVVFHRLKLPVVLGYLLAGLVIGPYSPTTLVADPQSIRTLAELGVILLMFSLGLDFNLHKLARLAPTAGLVGVIEVGLMLSLGYLAGQLLGWGTVDSIFAGAIVAISSTMIIAKVFAERGVPHSHSDLVFGILIVEDLAAILLIAILTAVATGAGLSTGTLATTLGRLVAFLVGLLVVGILIVPRVVRAIVRLRKPETTLVASVGLCFAVALLASAAGFSVALGAFLAGSLVAESGSSRPVAELIRPVRDMFAAIFFVAVGMLIDQRLIFEHWGAVVLLAGVVLTGKILGVSVGAFLAGFDTRTSVRTGMTLTQIGEFSFIIAGVGAVSGATSEFLYPVAVAVSVLTAFSSPWMIAFSDRAGAYVDRRLPKPLQTYATLYGSWVEALRNAPRSTTPRGRIRRLSGYILIDAAIIAGIVAGTSVALPRILPILARSLALGVTIGRLVVVAAALALAFPFLIGLVRSSRSLAHTLATSAFPTVEHGKVDLGLAPRRALLVTLEIFIVLLVGAPLVAVTQPFLPTYGGLAVLVVALVLFGAAFWQSARNLEGHVRATAGMVVHALARQVSGERPSALEEVRRLAPELGSLTPLTIRPGSSAVGKSLAQLNVRGMTGATVVALCRGEDRIVFPKATETLLEGDLLALSGAEHAIDEAKQLLR